MSHTTTIAVKIRDLDCLERAAQRCGVTLRRDQKQFRYFAGNKETCDHLLYLNETAYEIGVIKDVAKEEYSLSFDTYAQGHGMMSCVGDNCTKLMQMYALEVARQEAQVYVAEGWEMTEINLPNGVIQLRLTQGVAGW